MKEMLPRDVPLTFYWSVNSCDPEIRAELMPATEGENLFVVRDLFEEDALERGRNYTSSSVVIPGKNDQGRDVDLAVGLFGGRQAVRLKHQAYKCPGEYKRYPTIKRKQLEQLNDKYLKAGLDSRIREVVGGINTFSGCGTTRVICTDYSWLELED